MSEQVPHRFGRILVATDGSKHAEAACQAAAAIAKGFQSRVTVLNAIPSISAIDAPLGDRYYARLIREAEETVEKASSIVRKEGLEVEKEVLQGRASPVQTIMEFAADTKSDLIVLGTRGLGGLRRAMLGSVSSGVATHARCSVLVVRPEPSEERLRFKRILVAVDGSEHAKRATEVAAEMAKALGAGLELVHVIYIPSLVYAAGTPIPIDKIEEGAAEIGEKYLSEAAALAEKSGVKATRVLLRNAGVPAQEISDYASKNKVDLIVVGTRGLEGFKKLLLGSVANSLLHYAQCSVLVAR